MQNKQDLFPKFIDMDDDINKTSEEKKQEFLCKIKEVVTDFYKFTFKNLKERLSVNIEQVYLSPFFDKLEKKVTSDINIIPSHMLLYICEKILVFLCKFLENQMDYYLDHMNLYFYYFKIYRDRLTKIKNYISKYIKEIPDFIIKNAHTYEKKNIIYFVEANSIKNQTNITDNFTDNVSAGIQSLNEYFNLKMPIIMEQKKIFLKNLFEKYDEKEEKLVDSKRELKTQRKKANISSTKNDSKKLTELADLFEAIMAGEFQVPGVEDTANILDNTAINKYLQDRYVNLKPSILKNYLNFIKGALIQNFRTSDIPIENIPYWQVISGNLVKLGIKDSEWERLEKQFLTIIQFIPGAYTLFPSRLIKRFEKLVNNHLENPEEPKQELDIMIDVIFHRLQYLLDCLKKKYVILNFNHWSGLKFPHFNKEKIYMKYCVLQNSTLVKSARKTFDNETSVLGKRKQHDFEEPDAKQ